MKRKWIPTLLLCLSLLMGACNLPGSTDSAGGVETAAAQTVAAQQTLDAEDSPTATDTSAPSPSDTPEPSNTPEPSDTPEPSATPTEEEDCDAIDFVADVTIPDGTDFAAGDTFTKTWRLLNAGTCTWTTSYALVFDSGNAMGGPASQALSGTVAPGDNVDISVDLTAPATDGTYRGNWKLRNADGVIFGLPGPFYVEIDVVGAGGAGNTTTTITADQDGSVRSNGDLNDFPNTGDTGGNLGSQAFVSFDLSGIPDTATIIQVTTDFRQYDTLDDPFGDLGCLRGYPGNYFPLGAGDYESGSPLGAVTRWCNTGELDVLDINGALTSEIQGALAADAYELRLQFNDTETDNDGADDMVRFGDVRLIIIYSTP